MESAGIHLKAMLEITSEVKGQAHDADKIERRDEEVSEGTRKHLIQEESPEETHKITNKLNKLEKDLLYWQDKVFLNI